MLSASLESTEHLQFFKIFFFCKLFCPDFHLFIWLWAPFWHQFENQGHFKLPLRAYGNKWYFMRPKFAGDYTNKASILSALVTGMVILTWVHSHSGPCSKGQLTQATRQHTVEGCFTRILTTAGHHSWTILDGALASCLSLSMSLKSALLWWKRSLTTVPSPQEYPHRTFPQPFWSQQGFPES